MGKFSVDLSGQRFGRLVVLHREPVPTHLRSYKWVCQCDCGAVLSVRASQLREGRAKSCGCYRTDLSRDRFTAQLVTHGLSRAPIYYLHQNMLKRCGSLGGSASEYYGGRGIKVCERWLSFENFYADMGDRPPGMSLDRIDNNGPYSPENCRWATLSQQQRNTSKTKYVEFRGSRRVLQDVCDDLGVSYRAVRQRIFSRGWDVERALTTPVKTSK